jgi:hypothetical protein
MARAHRRSVSAGTFVDDALASFERAADDAGIVEHDVQLADRVARLRFAGDALERLLLPALEHLRVPDVGEAPALTVALFDTESTGVRMVPAPWPRDAYGPKGEIVGYNDDRYRVVFEPGIDILQAFDCERAVGVYWTPSHRYVPWWERSFPLRTTFHWWTSTTRSLQPLHAGAVGRHDTGVLVAGGAGSGKSTTTLACLDGGLRYAGDDYVLVDVDEPRVYSLYSTAKLVPDNLYRFPQFEPFVDNADALDEQKAMVFLHDHRPEQLATGFAIRAIVLPRVTGKPESAIVPATPRDALTAIAPTTLFQLPGSSPEVFAKVSRLTRAVPAVWLEAGTDLTGIPLVIDDLLAQKQPQ